MNPTVYFEYVSRDAQADKVDYKLLLGDKLAPGWHFGSNLVLAHELVGAGEIEYGLTLGLARTLVDEKFSLGAEVKAALLDEHADRGGPDSRGADTFLVVGWECGRIVVGWNGSGNRMVAHPSDLADPRTRNP
jgi:hypothetical protein